jgi:hypothetical protein
MKKFYIIFFSLVCYISSFGQTDTTNKKDINTIIELTNGDYDMGKISAGKPLEFNVYIKNISTDTLILQDVKTVCGCTTPKFKTADKILPGKSIFITLGFNGNATGEFSKFADIYFKGGLSKQVKFHGIAIADGPATPPRIQR